jgi:hypothetical protein
MINSRRTGQKVCMGKYKITQFGGRQGERIARESNLLEGQGVNGRIILKWVLDK